MEIRTCQEGDPTRLKFTRETGRITVTVGRDVYVLMDGPNKSELFVAYAEKDAFYIEFVLPRDTSNILLSA